MESLKDKIGYTLSAKKKTVGKIRDFTIDEKSWKIKHMVICPTHQKEGKDLLVPLQVLKTDVRNNQKEIGLQVPRKFIQNLPNKNEIPSVSLEQEMYICKKNGWLSQLKSKLLKGPLPNKYVKDTLRYVEKPSDNTLRSFNELKKYSVFSLNGELGRMEDFILDPDTWEITHVMFSTKKMFRRVRVLISTDWVTQISWVNSEIDLGLSNRQIKFRMKYIPEAVQEASSNRVKEYLVN